METFLEQSPLQEFFKADFLDTINSVLPSINLSQEPGSIINSEKVNKKITKCENSEVIIESPHPYLDNSELYVVVEVPNALQYTIVFDERSKTEKNFDYICFYKNDEHNEYWGDGNYSGRNGDENFPGTGDRLPLVIDASRFVVYFKSDGSTNDWGYRIKITPLIIGIECCEVDDLVDVFIPRDHKEATSSQIYDSARSAISQEPEVLADTLLSPEWSMREQLLKEINKFIASSKKIVKSQLGGPAAPPFTWASDAVPPPMSANSETDQLSSLFICSSIASMYAQDFDKRFVATEKFCQMMLKSLSPCHEEKPGEMLAGETIGANRSASSEYNHDLGASQSALRTVFRNSPKCWSAASADANQFVAMHFGNCPQHVTAIHTRGSGNSSCPEWVTAYKLQFFNGREWEYYRNGLEMRGNADIDSTVVNAVDIICYAIRIVPVTWKGHISMRFDVLIDTRTDTIRPGSALAVAMGEIESFFTADIAAFSDSEVHRKTMEAEVSVLFALAVLKGSLSSMLTVVETILAKELHLTIAVAPYAQYYFRHSGVEMSEGYFEAGQGCKQVVDIMRCLAGGGNTLRSRSFLVTSHNEVESLIAMAEKYLSSDTETHSICLHAIATLSSNFRRTAKYVSMQSRSSILDRATRDRLQALLDTILSTADVRFGQEVLNHGRSLYAFTIDFSMLDQKVGNKFLCEALLTNEGPASRLGVVLSAISDAETSDLIDLSERLGFENIVNALISCADRYIMGNRTLSEFNGIEGILLRSLERVIIVSISCLGNEISKAMSSGNDSVASCSLEKLYRIMHKLLLSAGGFLSSQATEVYAGSRAMEASYLGSLVPLAILNVYSILKVVCKANPELLMAERDWAADTQVRKSSCLLTLHGHSQGIYGIIQLADGRICSASADEELWIWNSDLSATEMVLKGHTNSVVAVCQTSSGLVCSGGEDCVILIWDTRSGKVLRTLEGHADSVFTLFCLPDGRLVSGSADKTLRIWNLDSYQCEKVIRGHSDSVQFATLLRDGTICTASWDKTLRRIDVSSGETLRLFTGHTADVVHVSQLSDDRICSCSLDATIRLWNIDSGDCEQVLVGHKLNSRWTVQLSSGQLVSCSKDKTIRFWDLPTGKMVKVLRGHSDYVRTLLLLADGRIVSGSDDHTMRVWSTDSGSRVFIASSTPSSGQATRAAVTAKDVASVDLPFKTTANNYDRFATLRGHTRGIWGMTQLADGRICSAGADNDVRVWNLDLKNCDLVLRGHTKSVVSVCQMSNGWICSGAQDRIIRLWDPQSGANLGTLNGHNDSVFTLTSLPDGRLVSGSADKTLRVWNLTTLQCEKVIRGHTESVQFATLLRDGTICTASWDKTLRRIDVSSGETLRLFTGHTADVVHVSQLSDDRICSCSLDATIRLWNIDSGDCEQVLVGHKLNSRWTVQLSSGQLVSCSKDKTIRFWDLPTGKTIKVLRGHSDYVRTLLLLADGRIVSGSDDHTMRVWSCQDDLVGSNAAYVQPLATAYFSLRLFIVEQLMSVNKHSAPQPDELGGDSSLKCSEWLESPLFSHGIIDDPEVLNSPDHRLMLNFIENPAGEDCATLVKFMQQRVLSDRTGTEKRINHAVHAACAALLWHHGLAAEGLAIVEGKRSSPSAEMVKIWSLGQKIRAFLDEGELQKAQAQAQGDSNHCYASLLPFPGADDAIIQTTVDNIIDRSKNLLLFARIPSEHHSVEKKLWKKASKLARMKLGSKISTGRDLASIVESETAAVQLHESMSMKRAFIQRAKEKRVQSLGEMLLQFLQNGPTSESLMRVIQNRKHVSQSRCNGMLLASQMLKAESDITNQFKILATVAESQQRTVGHVHFMSNLQGISASALKQLRDSWKTLCQHVVQSCLSWIQSLSAATSTASSLSPSTLISLILMGMSIVVQDFLPNDLGIIKDTNLIHLLQRLSESDSSKLANLAIKCTSMIMQRCCSIDWQSDSLLIDKETQAEINDAVSTALPGLISIIYTQICRIAPAGAIPMLPESVCSSTPTWLLTEPLCCDRAEGGIVSGSISLSSSFSLSAWVFRPNESSMDGILIMKGGNEKSILKYLSVTMELGSIVAIIEVLNEDLSNVEVRVSSGPVSTGVWTHILLSSDPNAKNLTLYIDGKMAQMVALPERLCTPHSSDTVNAHPLYFGQPPVYLPKQRTLLCRVANACIFHCALDATQALELFESTAPSASSITTSQVGKLLGALCRKARSLLADNGKRGIEILLAQGILSPLMRLMFKATSTTVRLASSQAFYIIAPFAMPSHVLPELSKVGAIDATATVEALFDRYGSSLNLFSSTSNNESEGNDVKPLAFTLSRQYQLLLDAIFNGCQEWVQEMNDSLSYLLRLASGTLDGICSNPEQQHQRVQELICSRDMNLIIGLLAYIGNYSLGLQPGDFIIHKSSKRRSLPEEYVILSYDSRCPFGETVIVTPTNSFEGNIEIESVKVTEISQEKGKSIKFRSNNIQNFIYENSDELLQLLGQILTVERGDDTQSPLTLTVCMLRNLAIHATDAVIECVTLRHPSKDGTIYQSLLNFTRTIRPALIWDFISIEGPVSCNSSCGVLEAARNGHFGAIFTADSSCAPIANNVGIRSEKLTGELTKLGESILDAHITPSDDNTVEVTFSPSVATALAGPAHSEYGSDIFSIQTSSSQTVPEVDWEIGCKVNGGNLQDSDVVLSDTIANPIQVIIQSFARLTASKASSLLRTISEMENWSDSADDPQLLGQLYILLKLSSKKREPKASDPLAAAPFFVSREDTPVVMKICNFIFAQAFNNHDEGEGSVSAVLKHSKFTEGMPVLAAMLGNQGMYFRARIKRVIGDGTFDIDYDDGDFEEMVPERNIHISDDGDDVFIVGAYVNAPSIRNANARITKVHDDGRVDLAYDSDGVVLPKVLGKDKLIFKYLTDEALLSRKVTARIDAALVNLRSPSLSMALALTSMLLTQSTDQDSVDEGILVGLEKCFSCLDKLSVEMVSVLIQCVALLFQRNAVSKSSLLGIANDMMDLLKAATAVVKTSPSVFYQSILETSLLAARFLGVSISALVAEILPEDCDNVASDICAEPLVLESPHPYGPDDEGETPVCIPGAIGYKIVFSEETVLDEEEGSRLTFLDENNDYLGEERYTGGNNSECNFPGILDIPALEINVPEFKVSFIPQDNDDDCWGYKMTITPIFSNTERNGLLRPIRNLDRFYSTLESLRNCDGSGTGSEYARTNAIDKHLVALLEAIISADKFPGATVNDLLNKSWGDFEKFADGFVQYPSLVAVLDDCTTGANQHFEKLSEGHSSLIETRFDVLFQFNRDFLSCASLIDHSQVEKKFSLAFKISSCRKLLLAQTKEKFFKQGFSATESKSSRFELVLSRPRAAKYAAKGICDHDGRWSVFGQAFRAIQGKDPSCLRQKTQLWDVIFAGEHSQDLGGPYNESWSTFCQELMSSSLPLLKPCPNGVNIVGLNRETWVLNSDATSPEQLEMFHFLGKLMGVAARSQHYMDLNLAPIVWKLIVVEDVTPEDFKAVDNIGALFIEKMRAGRAEDGISIDRFEADFGWMTFTAMSLGGTEIELHPGGAEDCLTWATRGRYCEEREKFHLSEMKPAACAIRSGLLTQMPQSMLALLTGDEFERMVCGSPNIDINLLKSATEYSGYDFSHQIIQMLWRILESFSQEDRRMFLKFTWGRSRLPLTLAGFKQKMKVTRELRDDPDLYLPVSHTCFFTLDLPSYTNEATMREKLLYAIYHCTAIDGDDTSLGFRAAAMAAEDDY